MTFSYSDALQRSPEWFGLRRGKVTASRLVDWLAVSKAKGKEGEPLKARLDYERELRFERQFGVNYNNFITAAMQDGIDLEGLVRQELSRTLDSPIIEIGCWYSDRFVASPDGLAHNLDAIVEIKVLRDASFTELLANGMSEAHQLQVQGGLLASGMDKAYYAALNVTTKAIKVIEVKPDQRTMDRILRSLDDDISVDTYSEDGLFFIKDAELPAESLEGNPWE